MKYAKQPLIERHKPWANGIFQSFKITAGEFDINTNRHINTSVCVRRHFLFSITTSSFTTVKTFCKQQSSELPMEQGSIQHCLLTPSSSVSFCGFVFTVGRVVLFRAAPHHLRACAGTRCLTSDWLPLACRPQCRRCSCEPAPGHQ